MLNLVTGNQDKSRANQFEYLDYAQANSRYPVLDKGADPAGWAKALNRWGAGRGWGVNVSRSMSEALSEAAYQIRVTRKPVGLLVKNGSHAWVMTGFEATADPAAGAYTVTAAEVVGPLWPDGTLDGRPHDPGPRTWLTAAQLRHKFDRYRMPLSPAWNGRWVTVVPDISRLRRAPAAEVPYGQLDLADPVTWLYLESWTAIRHVPVGIM